VLGEAEHFAWLRRRQTVRVKGDCGRQPPVVYGFPAEKPLTNGANRPATSETIGRRDTRKVQRPHPAGSSANNSDSLVLRSRGCAMYETPCGPRNRAGLCARMELMAMEDDAVSTRSRLTLSQSGPCARTHRRFDRAVRPKDTWTGVVHTHWCMHKSRALCTALLSICVKCCETRRFEAGCGYAEVMNSNGIIIFLLAQTAESGELGSSIESWTESL
jgi:hypothetical protein